MSCLVVFIFKFFFSLFSLKLLNLEIRVLVIQFFYVTIQSIFQSIVHVLYGYVLRALSDIRIVTVIELRKRSHKNYAQPAFLVNKAQHNQTLGLSNLFSLFPFGFHPQRHSLKILDGRETILGLAKIQLKNEGGVWNIVKNNGTKSLYFSTDFPFFQLLCISQ